MDEILRQSGGTIEQCLVLTGEYDLLYVVEFASDTGVLSFSLRAQAGGFYVIPHRAYTAADVDTARAPFLSPAEGDLETDLIDDMPEA